MLDDDEIEKILDTVEEEYEIEVTGNASYETEIESLTDLSIEMMKALIQEDEELGFLNINGTSIEWEPQDDELTTDDFEEQIQTYKSKVKEHINVMMGTTAFEKAFRIIGKMNFGGDLEDG